MFSVESIFLFKILQVPTVTFSKEYIPTVDLECRVNKRDPSKRGKN